MTSQMFRSFPLLMFFSRYACMRSHGGNEGRKCVPMRQNKQLKCCFCGRLWWMKIILASCIYVGSWPVSLHPNTELCFSPNVGFCLCNLQKFVSVASKLTALQNTAHLNKHHCPSFISSIYPGPPSV